MCLRTTPARIAAGVRLQTTPTRPNSFFEHLCPDVRWMIYDIMEFFPMPEETDYNGFYMTCKQAKQELDESAAVFLRLRLLEVRRHFRRYRVEVAYPPELDDHPLPIHAPVVVKITARLDLSNHCDIVNNLFRLASRLHVLRFKRLYLHFIDASAPPVVIPDLLKYVALQHRSWTAMILEQLVGANSWLAKEGRRLKVKDLRVSMEIDSRNRSEKPKFLEGYIYRPKITQETPSTVFVNGCQSHDYRATVHAVINPGAFERGDGPTIDELGPVRTWWRPDLNPVERRKMRVHLETGEFYSYPPTQINATTTNA